MVSADSSANVFQVVNRNDLAPDRVGGWAGAVGGGAGGLLAPAGDKCGEARGKLPSVQACAPCTGDDVGVDLAEAIGADVVVAEDSVVPERDERVGGLVEPDLDQRLPVDNDDPVPTQDRDAGHLLDLGERLGDEFGDTPARHAGDRVVEADVQLDLVSLGGSTVARLQVPSVWRRELSTARAVVVAAARSPAHLTV